MAGHMPYGSCTATAKSTGKPCGRPAVLGGKVCRFHGGAAPQVRDAGAARAAIASITSWEAHKDRNPQDVLLEMVSRSAALVHTMQDEKAYPASIELAARLSKSAIDAGIAERTVKIAEQQGEMIASVIVRVLERLQLPPEVLRQGKVYASEELGIAGHAA